MEFGKHGKGQWGTTAIIELSVWLGPTGGGFRGQLEEDWVLWAL